MSRAADIEVVKARLRAVEPALARPRVDAKRRVASLSMNVVELLPAYVLLDLLRQLPADTTICEIGRSVERLEVYLHLRSTHFPEVEQGRMSPRIEVELTVNLGGDERLIESARLIFPFELEN